MPRWVDAERVTFKYGLGEEFIGVLEDAAQAGPGLHDSGQGGRCRGVTARRGGGVPARPGRARRPHARGHVRRHVGDRHRHRRQTRARSTCTTLVDNAWSMVAVRQPGRGVADRGQPRRGPRAGGVGGVGGRRCARAPRPFRPSRSSTSSTSTGPLGARRTHSAAALTGRRAGSAGLGSGAGGHSGTRLRGGRARRATGVGRRGRTRGRAGRARGRARTAPPRWRRGSWC